MKRDGAAAPPRDWSSQGSVLLAALLGLALARAVTHFALGDVPHVMDEIAYSLQARMIAAGRIAESVHLPRAAFAMWFVDDRSATYSIFPPGWPSVLAIGAKLDAMPWVNPILHALTVPFVARAAHSLGGRRAKVAAAFAYALSPQALFVAASFMSHALVAFSAAVCLNAGLDAKQGRARVADYFGAGAALGLVLLTRPLCAVALGLGLLAFFVGALVARRRLSYGGLAALVVPAVLSIFVLCIYNRTLTSDPLKFPQTAWFDEHVPPIAINFFRYHKGCNELGFGPTHGCDFGIKDAAHTPENALSNTGDNVTSWMLLAGGGPLVFVGIVLALFSRKRALGRIATLAVPASVIVLYAFYWYAGTCYGARFYHAGLPALLALGVVGFSDRASRFVRALVAVVWLGVNGATFAAGLGEVRDLYWGTDDRFVDLAPPRAPAIVMVAFEEDGAPMHRLHVTGFTSKTKDPRWMNSVRALSALAQNDVALRGPVLFAKYYPQLVAPLRALFPDRALYLYVMHRDRAKDQMLPFDGSRYAEEDQVGVMPPDNFDGYVVLPTDVATR